MTAAIPSVLPTIDEVRTALAERSLRHFVEQAWHVLEPGTKFVPGIHVDAICEHLQAVTDGRIHNLIINVPPGHAKSLITCVFWPAWAWIRRPSLRWVFGSYKVDLASRDSVKCRTLIDSAWYQERWGHIYRFRSDQNQKTRYENTATGARVITSIGGGGTGERGDIVVIDDPTSVDEAESDTQRTTANEWITGTMPTRLNDLDSGHTVIIQQRLHEDDATGRLVELGLVKAGSYEHLVLMEEFEPDRACSTCIGWKDPRKESGELLWPHKISSTALAEIKLTMGSYRYAGQYQQRPSPSGGGIFQKHWWRYWKPKFMDLRPIIVELPDGSKQRVEAIDLPDKFDEQIQSWDMAFKDKQENDYVAGGVWGAKGAMRFLLDQRRERLSFPQTLDAVRAMTRRWPDALTKCVEDKANGPAVIQSLRQEIPGLLAIEPDGGKIARAQAVSPYAEAGNVYLPHPAIAPWVEAYINELATFPNGRHDDQVDQTSQALRRLSGQRYQPAGPKQPQRIPQGSRSWMA